MTNEHLSQPCEIDTSQVPVCAVDLDGTLVRSDILWEACIRFICRNPFHFFVLLWWMTRGRIALKQRLFHAVAIDVRLLPYNQEVLDYLNQQKQKGRTLVLASASPVELVQKVADHVGIFDHVMGTRDGLNLKSRTKRDEIARAYPEQPYEYIGNEGADFAVWSGAEVAGVVNSSRRFFARVKRRVPKAHLFSIPTQLGYIPRLMRVHQWVKNILVFVPWFLSHPSDIAIVTVGKLVAAFFSLSLSASSVYIYNDLCDMASDRKHPDKRRRPLAAARVSVPYAMIVGMLSFFAAIAISLQFVSWQYTVAILVYAAFVVVYTVSIKRIMLLDVLGLSALYVFRIFAGGVAAHVEVSQWLLTCSAFFFLNLAFVKRFVELVQLKTNNGEKTHGRGYCIEDSAVVRVAGIASGFLSVLVFYLYITNSTAVLQLYAHPRLLWLIGPVLIYWISRIWMLASRGEVLSDPVEFAIKDPLSWVSGAAIVSIAVLGSM